MLGSVLGNATEATSSQDAEGVGEFLGWLFAGTFAVVIVGFVFWLIALIDILKSEFKNPQNKLIWLLVTLFIPFLGPLLYFFLRKSQQKPGSGLNLGKVFTILSFFAYYPLGVLLMWVLMKWPVWLKILLSLPLVIFVIPWIWK